MDFYIKNLVFYTKKYQITSTVKPVEKALTPFEEMKKQIKLNLKKSKKQQEIGEEK